MPVDLEGLLAALDLEGGLGLEEEALEVGGGGGSILLGLEEMALDLRGGGDG